MKAYYVLALGILLTFAFYAIYSFNFSSTESISVHANVTNCIVRINGNYVTITNVYSFTVSVYYGNYNTTLYPGQSVTFPYQPGNNVILKANGFEEIIEVN